jgi:hypothetical protein
VRKNVWVALLVGAAASLLSTPTRAAYQTQGTRKAPAERLDSYQVPAGTALLLKLRTPVDSATASIDDQVEATLWSPVIQNGIELIPAGSVAIGKVIEVKRASERTPTGTVAFVFSIVEHAETGSRAMLSTRKVLVESPRPDESVPAKKRAKTIVQATMPSGAPFVAMTAEPLVVRIPR